MLEFILHSRVGMVIVLSVAIAAIIYSLNRRSHNVTSKVNIDDLLLGDDDKLSKAAAVMLGSFLITSWILVYLTLTEKLTEFYFGGYIAAWVAPAVTRIIKGPAA